MLYIYMYKVYKIMQFESVCRFNEHRLHVNIEPFLNLLCVRVIRLYFFFKYEYIFSYSS